MTANSIRAKEAQENARANKAKERENYRHNTTTEKETERTNRKNENIKVGQAVTKGFSDVFGTIGKFANDPQWYGSGQLLKDVASIAYGQPLGVVNVTKGVIMEGSRAKLNKSVPGVLNIKFIPTIGSGEYGEENSATIAARNIYSWIRHANSGSANYDAPDLMMYLLAVDSVYTLIGWAVRCYSLLRDAKAHNRFYPRAMLLSEGWSDSQIDATLQDLANFRSMINQTILRVNALRVPNVMPYYARHTFLVTNIFKDSAIKKSSEIKFIPEYFYQYQESFNRLEPKKADMTTGQRSLTDAFNNWFRQSLDALIQSESIGIMSGDILKAYGDSGLYFLNFVPDDFHIESIFSMEVLAQINSGYGIFKTYSVDTSSLYIRQLDNGVIYQGVEAVSNVVIPGIRTTKFMDSERDTAQAIHDTVNNMCINMYRDDPTPEDTMVSSRLMFKVAIGGSTDANFIRISTCGSEVISSFNISYYTGQDEAGLVTIDLDSVYTMSDPTDLFNLETLVAFDWAPHTVLYYKSGSNLVPVLDTMDYCNYTTISEKTLNGMHAIALFTQLGVDNLNAKRGQQPKW